MADLRDYQPLMFSVYSSLSKQRTSSKYFQIRASGCERFDLFMRGGKICDIRFSSNLKVFRLAAEKKSSWRSAREVGTDFGFLTQWEKTSEHLLSQAEASDDPRPPFVEMPRVESLPSGLVQYDPEAASLCSAVIFHRIFQTLSPVLERGFLIDYRTSWLHGASRWNDAPMTFAWIDANGFCFEPHTLMNEYFCLYHPDKPRLRRHFCCSSWRLNDMACLKPFVDALSVSRTAPCFTWNPKNYDRIIFMPSAVIEILKYCLEQTAAEKKDSITIRLPSGIDIVDDPRDPLFGRQIGVDSSGMPLQSRILVKNGLPEVLNDGRERFGEGTDAASIFYPVLKASDSSEASECTAESLSSSREGRTLFIEKVRLFSLDGHVRIFVPDGGALYRDGRCLGHVVPPQETLVLDEYISGMHPVGNPVRIGNAAVCALEFAP